MKRFVRVLGLGLFGMVCVYTGFVFVLLEPNPLFWLAEVRFLFVALAFPWGVALVELTSEV